MESAKENDIVREEEGVESQTYEGTDVILDDRDSNVLARQNFRVLLPITRVRVTFLLIMGKLELNLNFCAETHILAK